MLCLSHMDSILSQNFLSSGLAQMQLFQSGSILLVFRFCFFSAVLKNRLNFEKLKRVEREQRQLDHAHLHLQLKIMYENICRIIIHEYTHTYIEFKAGKDVVIQSMNTYLKHICALCRLCSQYLSFGTHTHQDYS